jgi:hypothetical protein
MAVDHVHIQGSGSLAATKHGKERVRVVPDAVRDLADVLSSQLSPIWFLVLVLNQPRRRSVTGLDRSRPTVRARRT